MEGDKNYLLLQWISNPLPYIQVLGLKFWRAGENFWAGFYTNFFCLLKQQIKRKNTLFRHKHIDKDSHTLTKADTLINTRRNIKKIKDAPRKLIKHSDSSSSRVCLFAPNLLPQICFNLLFMLMHLLHCSIIVGYY